jgi:hypothetical protein
MRKRTNMTADNHARIVALEQKLSQVQQELTYLRSFVTNSPPKHTQNLSVATGRRRFLKSLAGLGGVGAAALAFGSRS